MPASASALMQSSWFAVLSTVYTRIVLMPNFLNLIIRVSRLSEVSSLRVVVLSNVSLASVGICDWVLSL